MQKKQIKKVKHHIKWKPFMVLLVTLLVIFSSIYYISNLKIKHIYITGNSYLTDKEIIEIANIKNYPKMQKYSVRTLKKKISTLDLVSSVKIKKSWLGKLTIKIEEAKVLFYNRNNASFVLSNGKETTKGDYIGVPFLINYVPNSIYERLVSELSKINNDSIMLISEIEYSPSKSGEVVIDDTRFLLRMNDGNQVYINLINIDRLDMYALIYTGLNEKGILELDSDNDNVYFHS